VSALAVVVTLGLIAGQSEVGDAPPVPAPVVEEAVPPPVTPPLDDDDDDDDDKGDEKPAPETTPDAVAAEDDDWSMVTALSTTGCVAGGIIPGAGGMAGLALFYGGSAASGCGPLGLVSGIGGLVLAVPSLLALAPCAVGGAACGAAVGAVIDDEDPATAAAWTIPGLVVGTIGGGIAAAGLFVSQTDDRAAFGAGTTMVAVGSLLALVGGPLAIAGATLTRTPAVIDGDDKVEDKKLDDGTAVDVVHRTDATPVGFMRF